MFKMSAPRPLTEMDSLREEMREMRDLMNRERHEMREERRKWNQERQEMREELRAMREELREKDKEIQRLTKKQETDMYAHAILDILEASLDRSIRRQAMKISRPCTVEYNATF